MRSQLLSFCGFVTMTQLVWQFFFNKKMDTDPTPGMGKKTANKFLVFLKKMKALSLIVTLFDATFPYILTAPY